MPARSNPTLEPIRPIRTEADLDAALLEIERRWEAPPGSPEGDRLAVLSVLVEEFERRHFPFSAPDPVEAVRFRMEQAGLHRRDLAGMIGTRTRVDEVLRGDRRLTLGMIRRLNAELGIPAEVLIQGQGRRPVRTPAAKRARVGKA